MLADDKKVLEVILPSMVAFRAIKHGKDILIRKKSDMKKEQEKLERMQKNGTINIMGGTATSTMGATHHDAVEKKPTSKNTSPVRGQSPTKIPADKKEAAALAL
jgi:hypothetical protein